MFSDSINKLSERSKQNSNLEQKEFHFTFLFSFLILLNGQKLFSSDYFLYICFTYGYLMHFAVTQSFVVFRSIAE